MGWTETAVLAEIRQRPEGYVVEAIEKLPASRAVSVRIGGREYGVTGVDPDEMPTIVAREIRRQLALYK